jgi:hypothetical protein
VAVIESIQPAIIVIFSVSVFFFAKIFLKKNNQNVKFFHNEQLAGLPHKILAMIFMAIGIYLLN